MKTPFFPARSRRFFPLGKAFWLASPAIWLVGCRAKAPETASKIVVEAAKREVAAKRDTFSGLQGATLQGGQLSGGDAQGRPLWKLSARTIRAAGGVLESGKNADSGAPRTATLSDARATLYRDGKAESQLQAPQVTLFYLKNGVRLQFSRGMKGTTRGVWAGARGPVEIAAPRADVDVQNRVISASGGVQMAQGTVRVRAQTLRAQTSLQSATLTGRVRAISTDKTAGNGAGSGQIEADSALYNWQTNRLRAQKVTALREGTRLTGEVLEADTDAQSGVLSGQVRAQNAQNRASAPRLDFNWKRDQIRAPNATLLSPQGSARASNLVTDSKLRLASARDLVATQNGATLRAASATGLDGLTRIRAQSVDFARADLRFRAPRAVAHKVGAGWVLEAEGGARGHNAAGQIRAPRMTWDEAKGRVTASGGVTLNKAGATLTGQTLSGDTRFQNAVLSGPVRGQLVDGTLITAQKLEKRGETLLAQSGATAKFQPRQTSGAPGKLGTVTLRAARIEAPSDGSSASASGGVTLLTSTGATARAPRAIYNRAQSLVTASGGVDFFDPVRGLRTHGDTLIYNLKTNEGTLPYAQGQGSLDLFKGKKLF